MKQLSENQQIFLEILRKYNDTVAGEWQPVQHFIVEEALSKGITTIGMKRVLTALEKAGYIEYKRAKDLYDVEYKLIGAESTASEQESTSNADLVELEESISNIRKTLNIINNKYAKSGIVNLRLVYEDGYKIVNSKTNQEVRELTVLGAVEDELIKTAWQVLGNLI